MSDRPSVGSSHGNAAEKEASAVWILLASSLVLGVSDVFIKLVTDHVPPGQFMVLRGLCCVLFYYVIIGKLRRRAARQQLFNRRVLARSLLEATSVTCFILALQSLPVSTVTSLYMTSPVLTVFAAFILGMSRFRWRVIIGAGLAFAGVMLIASPRSGLDQPAVLLGLVAAVLVTMRDLITKAMPASISSSAVALATMIGVTLAGVLLDPAGAGWQVVGLPVAAMIASAAIFTTLGNHLVIEAFRRGDPAQMAVLRYSTIPIAIVLGWLILDQVPPMAAFVGSLMIVAAGMLGRSKAR